MTAKALLKLMRSLGCEQIDQRGSHVKMRAKGHCQTSVPVHPGETLGIGLMNKIEADMEHCLGEGWIK